MEKKTEEKNRKYNTGFGDYMYVYNISLGGEATTHDQSDTKSTDVHRRRSLYLETFSLAADS